MGVMTKKLSIITAGLLFCIHIYLGWSFIKSSAATYDESVHLASGNLYIATGRYTLNIMDHPPLAEMISAIPVSLMKLRIFLGHPYLASGLLYSYSNLFLYNNDSGAEKILNTARLFSLLFWSVLLAGTLGLWMLLLENSSAALWTLVFWAFMPAFITNNALVTTDAGGMVFFVISLFIAYLVFHPITQTGAAVPQNTQPTPKDKKMRRQVLQQQTAVFKLRDLSQSPLLVFILCAIATGLAMSCKFNMAVLPAMIMGMAVIENLSLKKFKWDRLFGLFAVYAVCVFFTIAMVYRLGQFHLYFDGLQETFKRLDQGRSSFILGRYSLAGIWWYFPFALAVKTPAGLFALAAAGLLCLKPRIKQGYLWIILPPLLYFLMALTAKLQIGYRHILPVFPFLVMLAGSGAYCLFRKNMGFKLIPAALSLWIIFSTVKTHPFYLAYFNEFAGGAENGYKMLVDSNLDWGQALKQLGEFIKKEGNPPLYLSYFGTADPAYYGIKTIPLAPITSAVVQMAITEDSSKWDRMLLAVSATNLQATYYPDKKFFDWLKSRKPVFTAGYSIFVYDLTNDPQGLTELADNFDKMGMNDESKKLFDRVKKMESGD